MFNSLPKVSPNSMKARIFLAFLTSAGLYYVNIMPAIVAGLIEALGFTNQQAGNVASANMYGAAFGALVIVFFVKRLNWQLVSTLFLGGLIAIDLFSIRLTDPTVLTAVRFCHGFIGPSQQQSGHPGRMWSGKAGRSVGIDVGVPRSVTTTIGHSLVL